MELIINIPEKEFGIDINDKFQDFFSRLRAEIKAHCVDNISLVCGAYELETINMFLKAFNNSTLLPKHGDLFDKDEILRFLKCPKYETCDWKNCFDCNESRCINLNNVNDLVPIIKADKEESEEDV